jgi:hypothetical protein
MHAHTAPPLTLPCRPYGRNGCTRFTDPTVRRPVGCTRCACIGAQPWPDTPGAKRGLCCGRSPSCTARKRARARRTCTILSGTRSLPARSTARGGWAASGRHCPPLAPPFMAPAAAYCEYPEGSLCQKAAVSVRFAVCEGKVSGRRAGEDRGRAVRRAVLPRRRCAPIPAWPGPL